MIGNVNYCSNILFRHRLESNIATDLKEVICVGVGWIHLAHDREGFGFFLDTVMPSGFIKCKEFASCATISLSSTTLFQKVIHF
jgi:hypothetical protein